MSLDEAVNRFLLLPPFIGIGAVLPRDAWADLGRRGPALAVGVLLLRRLPLLLVLLRPMRLGWSDALYLGWFGPMGASALFYRRSRPNGWGPTPPCSRPGASLSSPASSSTA